MKIQGNAQPDIDELRRFSKREDRGLSPYFAGRRAELGDLHQRCDRLFGDWRAGEDISGRTAVVTGCPGMGKTSLLRRFADECERALPKDEDAPLAVSANVHDLGDAGAFADALTAAALRSDRVRAALGALGGDIAKRLKAERTLTALKEAFFATGKRQARPVCLLIDEAQNAEPAHREVVSRLHEGAYDLPVLPVFAGLNDTEDALRRCGVSRLSNRARMPLGRLAENEAAEAVDSLFDRCRVSGASDELTRWRSAIASDSLGFPQHLHAGMEAAAGALVESEGRASPAGLALARSLAADERRAYYRSRLSPGIRAHGKALVDLVGELTLRPAGVQELKAMAYRRMQEHAAFGSPDEAEAERFVAALIHDGILQENAERTGYEVPIPSMAAWLQGEYARSLGLRP